MDNIWDKKSFEIGGHWPLWRGWKKLNVHAEPTKFYCKKKILLTLKQLFLSKIRKKY